MTYLNWGCDPLTGECEACLNAYCNVCNEEFKKKHGNRENPDGPDETCHDYDEPDCDHCDLEKKPDCAHCEIILAVCRNCAEFASCEFRI
ncbi:MAG: hypothetical protein LUQ71_00055 [Methanoregula sp.]|nr:hypothetical protein [Methanoregula sp.]